MFILVIVTYTAFAIYEFVPLYKQKLWREFGINLVLGLISLVIAIMLSLDIKIPSPVYPLEDLITALTGK